MNAEEAKIKARLEEILQSVFCPIAGCWCLYGCHYEYYYDEGCECHVIEAWPVGFEEPEEPKNNGREKHEGDVCYEFAEFEFSEITKTVPLEQLHFSQLRQLFEISWKEGGRDMELRLHIVPKEVECE